MVTVVVMWSLGKLVATSPASSPTSTPPPAGTAVQVTALAMPDLMIEIEAWAVCAD